MNTEIFVTSQLALLARCITFQHHPGCSLIWSSVRHVSPVLVKCNYVKTFVSHSVAEKEEQTQWGHQMHQSGNNVSRVCTVPIKPYLHVVIFGLDVGDGWKTCRKLDSCV